MIKPRLPTRFDMLLVWHGLLAGAYSIAYITAEGAPGLHRFAGYSVLGLLTLRLLAAQLAGTRPPWSLPLPKAAHWRGFAGKLARGEVSVLLGRTPLAPLSGLVILATLVLVTLSGVAADAWDWEDLHEGLTETSLAVVLTHIAIVSFAPLWKALRSAQLDTGTADAARKA